MTKKTELKYAVKTETIKYKTVSARVPQDLADQFQKAVDLANKNGMDLNITHVVQVAMQDAIKELRKEIGQGTLPLQQ